MSLNKNNISLTTVLVKLIKEELNNSFINENKLYPTNIVNNLTKKLGDNSQDTINKLAIFGLFRQAPPFNTIKDINQLGSLEQLNELFDKWKESALQQLVGSRGELKGNKTASTTYLDAYVDNIASLGNEAKPFSYKDVEQTLIDVANNKGWIKSNDKSTQTSNIESPDKQDILFEDNTILIVKAPSKAKCIMYGQGKTWCISQTGLNMYNTYRIKYGASIYFVLNKTKSKEDKERVCVILRYSGDKYGIADATNSGQRSGGPEVAGQGFSYVESELPWLTGKGQYFPESKVTQSEKNYAKFIEKQYTRNDLGNYIINAAKQLKFNKEEVDPVDLFRDYIASGNSLNNEQFKSLTEPMKVQLIEMGYKLSDEMIQLLDSNLKVRYAVIKLKNKDNVNISLYTQEERGRVLTNIKDILDSTIISIFLRYLSNDEHYRFVQQIFPIVKDKLDQHIIYQLLMNTPNENKYNLVLQIFPIVKDKLNDGIIRLLLNNTPEDERYKLTNQIIPLVKDNWTGEIIQNLLKNIHENERSILLKDIFEKYKNKLDGNMINAILEYTPENERNVLLKEIFQLVKDKLNGGIVGSLLKYTPDDEIYSFIKEIIELMKEVLDKDGASTIFLLKYTPEQHKDEIKKLLNKYRINQRPINENKLNIMLKNMIKEELESVIDEATYPENFDLEKFKQLRSFKDRVNYCNSTLKKLGSGSSRIVYLVDDKTVLKLAKNQKGIAQNKVEIGASDKYYSNVTAEVYESDDNSLWLEMELAKPINKARFKEILGYSVEDFGKWVTNFWNVNNRKKPYYTLDKQLEEIINESEFANSVFSFIQDYGLSVGDLGRISTYGEFDGEVKIIDYGLDDDVLSNYYRKISEEFNIINNDNKEMLVEIEPEEVSTKTIKFSNQLNSKLWDKDELLKPEVRIAILKISKKYINSIDKNIKFKDIVLTGSIANYNYNEQSDLDIHIVVDYKNIGDDENLLLKYFKGIKDDWSNKYKLTIYGYPVEIFIQNERTPIESAAVYSVLNNKWVQKPENNKPNFNIKEIKNIAAKFINKFDDLQKYFKVNKDYDKALSDIEAIKKEISDMRKVGLDKEGEFSTENLSFKLLRNLGTLDKINTFKEKLINKQLTLKESLNFLNENKLYPTNIVNNLSKKFGDNSDETLNKLAIFGLFRKQPPFESIKDINQLKSLDELTKLFNQWKEYAVKGLMNSDGELKGNKTATLAFVDAYINNIRSLKDDAKPFSFKGYQQTLIDVVNNNSWIKQNDVTTQTYGVEKPHDSDIMFEDDNIIILKGSTKAKCITYGQGYRWCISQTQHNIYNHYRITNGATIYFVLNKKLSKDAKERVCVILRYYNNKFSIADETNSGQRSGGPEVAGDGFGYVESQLSWLRGMEKYFPESEVTQSEKDYEAAVSVRYTGDDLGNYIINKSKKINFNGEEIDPVDFLRDYLLEKDISYEQFTSLTEPMKVQVVETGKLLDNEIITSLSSSLKVRYAVIRLIKDLSIYFTYYSDEEIGRVLNNIKDKLDYSIINRILRNSPEEQRYNLALQILPLVKDKLNDDIIDTLLYNTPEKQKYELVLQILPLIKDKLNKDNINVLFDYIDFKQKYSMVLQILSLVKDKLNDDIIGDLLRYTPNGQQYELVKQIFPLVKDKLDRYIISKLLTYTPYEEQYNLVKQILPLVKDKLDSRIIDTLIYYTPKEKKQEIQALIDNYKQKDVVK